MKEKLYIVIAVIIIFILGAFSGYSWCGRSYDKGVIKQQQKDAVNLDEHIEKKEKVKKNVNDKIKAFKEIPDPTGCLSVDSTDDYFDKLREADRAAESGFD